MMRYLQLTITEPLTPLMQENVNIKCATIGIDLATGEVTLPGGFVCSLQSLTGVVDKMRTEQALWMQSRRRLWRST